jgi:poly-gamma-glutamate synthesis protein (capsule biosynthesis protein)
MNPLITLFLCGDVMLGRGVDQLFPRSSDPRLHEPAARDARTYVELAEDENGPIRRPVSYEYVWGEALGVLEAMRPAARIINLETAVTTSDDFAAGKGIHYRMHPENVAVLRAGKIDVASLANNHTLDWGRTGLRDTLGALREAQVATAGAGADLAQAEAPAVIALDGDRRLLVFACAMSSSGTPAAWAAGELEPGLFHLAAADDASADRVAAAVRRHARQTDLVVLSIHWGGNWGYAIPAEQARFARRLIDTAGVDLIHGHSSHHIKAIEIYHDRPILYGAGDFINDYEGLHGKEAFRPDLRLMYFPTLDADSGRLQSLRIIPLRMKQMRLIRPAAADIRWVDDMLDRESAVFGVSFEPDGHGGLLARWRQPDAGE